MTTKHTISQLYAHYARHHLPHTRSPWRTKIAWSRLEPVFGDKTPDALNAALFDKYFTSRGAVSNSTINRETGVLLAILSHGRKHGLSGVVPYVPRRPSAPPRERVLTEEEQATLLDASSFDPSLGVFIKLALLTGQRKAAIVTLKWSQIKWPLKIVDFRDLDEANSARMKGRGVIPISGALEELLNEMLSKPQDNKYVIAEWNGDADRVTYPFQRACKIAGIKGVTPHTLRHTVATRLVRRGVPLLEVSRLLGHKSVVTTEKNYLSLTPDFIANAAMKLTLD